MHKHLAIMHKSTVDAILGGKKTVETRFSKAKIVPFGAVGVGDIIYMKLPGGDIVGQCRVKKVFSFEGLTPEDVDKIFKDYSKEISAGNKEEDERYKKEKSSSNFGTLIFISESERFITSPIKIKKSDLRGWMVLG
ncbi:hypothetical protein A3A14_01550 [Candidatus Daviesbacteria bacterium RIFCSPLOWO2_01_FULL_43_38]|uniref:Uncharacterized protein n=2 Tax=Candidatus Daviesiibacteriota TaxID=1752718 RepID=A0A0G1DH59_9BACT|nr:MAG: hypothetical protein UV41_C0035G0007 [Candidatus Daviesbacteria bacterium GW2011_GWA2_42_7]OGE19151.1 MAG: hypothetical protein A2874_01310 [Candidatus Daviesbacteria bacterium RIFCSPHIGHO2_01_FULL_43_17]OGE63877.1 MAG: hypothetical protein A3A14_01550 [Candidatus Daviesbacteria bacterium RIFCSPLOWO2_01_FULL_43_38]OGE70506.1 MAG: hypothetical protein A3J21_00300 [Candidatus Daviesbacteria bacterium RIFCSPLOWO2_02_FULL_43_11]